MHFFHDRGCWPWAGLCSLILIAILYPSVVISEVASGLQDIAQANIQDEPSFNRPYAGPERDEAQMPIDHSTSIPEREQRQENFEDGSEDVLVADDEQVKAAPTDSLHELVDALETMQQHFFEIWQGTWPSAIDWTAAVLGTYLSGALSTFSSAVEYVVSPGKGEPSGGDALAAENLINKHFSQLVAFYFGQDAFGLRSQANDDMLWVVLGWLESIKFINMHSSLHYTPNESPNSSMANATTGWYGEHFIPAFAHRARLFYDLASKGWDTEYCGGGMVWNPYLEPYKNAITNELYISASIAMYLYFPGDDNPSPFGDFKGLPPARAHDTKYLTAAIDAYQWLKSSNMTNAQGLYVDGFHISGYGDKDSTNKACDVRNEMVYTYNQGVLLSGLRGLWESTGARTYLDDGFTLISSVINATGGNTLVDGNDAQEGQWAGLGRDGILEETCDSSGTCSQNGQTFKGIFFHHLTRFCEPLPSHPMASNVTFAAGEELKAYHTSNCAGYKTWVSNNARAAYETRNVDGEYGTWWGNHSQPSTNLGKENLSPLPVGAEDYQNTQPGEPVEENLSYWVQEPIQDANDRGRGRTVETQGGAVAVLRALWEVVDKV